ncbi:unnamed protein product [Adineta steineri]|uniref:Major facilitator superfamily (MFS) profile domain-containing protein n=1 Tax=Adineta steineri TaxID=433720 RepID=A0A814S5W0_9BILA|nr:unnamed protein product [Adineta steineri]CAF1141909.1 unnamed protein product [Adineta steineri]
MLADLLEKNSKYQTLIDSENDTVISFLPWKSERLRTSTLLQENYKGKGNESSPYIINWLRYDPENPMKWLSIYKWFLTFLVTVATLAISFCSSAYTGPFNELKQQFHIGDEVITLGISLYVLGFAIGPLLWAPFSEVLGRRPLFIVTYAALTAFNAGAAASQNIWTLVILRFFAGAFGASPLTNAGGVIADLFDDSERGVFLALFTTAAFFGPGLGPVVGGFVGETVGWRWVEGVMAIFTGVIWILICFFLPETYSPVLLRRRAKKLSKRTGKTYRSKFEEEEKTKFSKVLKTSLLRPWALLFREPIVLLLSIYMAIIYGTLYLLFGAFPIVYQEKRGWSEGIGGLAFMGFLVGIIISVVYSILDNIRYKRVIKKSKDGQAPPEARLPPAMVGSIFIPIGLFWFAWTNSPSIHWIVSIIASAPVGFGMVLVFISIINYLIDAYTIYSASVLAANSVIRSIFGAAFPLFTTQMFHTLGIHWASCVPAFLALVCVPFPFLFYKYGAKIRQRCKYAAEAEEKKEKPTKTNSNENGQTNSTEYKQTSETKQTKSKKNGQTGETKQAKSNENEQTSEVKQKK